MKKLFVLLFAAMSFCATSYAQDTTTHAKMGMHKMKDGIKMKDGRMLVIKDGQWSAMTNDTTLTNGTTVSKDGTVKMTNGTTMQMKDGDKIDMNGNMMDRMKKAN